MIPDGCGTFTRSMGMLVDKPQQGFGEKLEIRSILMMVSRRIFLKSQD